MRQKVQNRMAEVRESVNMTSDLGVSFHSDKKRECKRKGKRMESDHSHTASACCSRMSLTAYMES